MRLILAATALLAAALSTSATVRAADPVTLHFWSNSANPVWKQVFSDFEAANPGIKVDYTPYSTNQFLQNMQVAATNQTLPDVFFEGLGATLAHQFIDNGRIMKLDDAAKAGNWDKQYLPLAVNLLAWKNSWWEVPYTALGMGIFYRKDIFDKYGIAIPKTLDDLDAAAAKLKQNGITPISIGGKGSWMTMRFTDALIENIGGPDFHDSLYTPAGDWTKPPVVKAFQTIKDWTDKGYFTKGFLSIDPQTDYVSWFQGKAAMIFEGPWEDSVIIGQKQDTSKFGFFPFPTTGTPRISAFAQGWMVAANTKYPDQALKLAEYLSSTAMLSKYADRLDGPFANVDVPSPANQPNQGAIKKLLATDSFYLPTDQRFTQEMVNTFFQHQDSVVAGTETPEQAAAAIQAAKSGS
jgi:raffinose/stachyose/melibiose transport system substrate-binding protein